MTSSVKPASASKAAPFDLKSTAVNVIAFTPHGANLADIEAGLRGLAGEGEQFFAGDAALIDLSQWPDSATALELSGMLALLRRAGLVPLATRGGSPASQALAHANGLVPLPMLVAREHAKVAEPVVEAIAPVANVVSPTIIVDKPVRSGQQIYARGGDLILLALVSHGAEVIADGNIHVYAPLRGRALAGAKGQTSARIFTHCMEAELISIGGIYRSLDEALPTSIRSLPTQIRLDGNKLVMEAMDVAGKNSFG